MFKNLKTIVGCWVMILACALSVAAQEPKPLPVEAFTRDPALEAPLVSPSGQQVAWVGGKTLFIYNAATQEFHQLQAAKNQDITLTSWASDKYLIVAIYLKEKDKFYKRRKMRNDIALYAGYILVDNKGSFIRPLFIGKDKKIADKTIIHKTIIHIDQGDEPFVTYIEGFWGSKFRARTH